MTAILHALETPVEAGTKIKTLNRTRKTHVTKLCQEMWSVIWDKEGMCGHAISRTHQDRPNPGLVEAVKLLANKAEAVKLQISESAAVPLINRSYKATVENGYFTFFTLPD